MFFLGIIRYCASILSPTHLADQLGQQAEPPMIKGRPKMAALPTPASTVSNNLSPSTTTGPSKHQFELAKRQNGNPNLVGWEYNSANSSYYSVTCESALTLFTSANYFACCPSGGCPGYRTACVAGTFYPTSTGIYTCNAGYSCVLDQLFPSLGANQQLIMPFCDLGPRTFFYASPVQSTTKAMSSSIATSISSAVSSTTAPAPTTPPAPHSNAGAIAGGVVGGLLALIALALGIFFFLRHKKRQQPATAANFHANEPIHQGDMKPTPAPAPAAAGIYDNKSTSPVPQSMHSPPPMYHSPASPNQPPAFGHPGAPQHQWSQGPPPPGQDQQYHSPVQYPHQGVDQAPQYGPGYWGQSPVTSELGAGSPSNSQAPGGHFHQGNQQVHEIASRPAPPPGNLSELGGH